MFLPIDVPIWFPMLVFTCLLLYVYGTMPFYVWKKYGISGPHPKPFFGNNHELFDYKIGCVSALRKWQKQFGRIYGIYMFRKPVLVVTDLDALKKIFVKDFKNYTNRFMIGEGDLQQRIIQKGIFFESSSNWKRIRKIMTPTFSSGKLKCLMFHINKTAKILGDTLIEKAENNSPTHAKYVFAAFSLDVITGTAFGLETNSQDNPDNLLMKHARSLMTFNISVMLKMTLVGMFPVLGSLMKALDIGFINSSDVHFFSKNLFHLIQERKNNQTDNKLESDFLQLLLNAEADSNEGFVGEKKLTTEEIVAQGIIFIIAGYETTSTLLQYLSYELAFKQDVQEKILSEIESVVGENDEITYEHCQSLKYMDAVIQEALRMYPPIHLLTRMSEQETDLGGYFVPRNAAILIPLYNIGRDPEYFVNPDKFDPDRFIDDRKNDIDPLSTLAFGYGPRQCIGMRLAIIQMKIALVYLIKNVIIRSVTPTKLDLEDYTGVLVPKQLITLKLESRRAKHV